jgi:hypothetical protein
MLIVSLGSLCGLLAGCGDGRPTRVPVAGKVLIDGKPLTVGSVRFMPESGRPATGALGADGSFKLGTFDAGDGAIPGAHTITVHASEEISPTLRRWNTPKKYENPLASGLKEQVDGPRDSVVINLTWGGEKGPFNEVIPLE